MKSARQSESSLSGPSEPIESPAAISAEPDDVLLRMPDVQKLLPLSKATIWRLVAARHLAAPIQVGARAVAWRREDIRDYVRRCERRDRLAGTDAHQSDR